MKHCRTTAAFLAAVWNPRAGLSTLAGLSPLVGIAVSLAGATPAWAGGGVLFTERVISTNANSALSVFAIDLDGDGDIDVLSASRDDNKIAWYESDGGSPPSFTERVISASADAARSVFATDLDGDGDVDVLSASSSDDKIAWYESDGGSPPAFVERVISTSADYALSVFAADVDGDGDTDVLSASFNDSKIAWYENDGGSPPSFTERVISTVAIGASSVFATDLDGDGDVDVLSASISDDKIAWYESDGGSPPAFVERVISTSADFALSVFATDVDGDGDSDVLSASSFDDKIAWYESDGGLPPTFTERVISTVADGARSVFATDVNGDGHIDVLSASGGDRKIAWYESSGASPPTFTERVISTAANFAGSVFATDVDGDGDTDVLSASFFDDKIAWYENTICPLTCGDGVLCLQTEECDDGYADACGSCNADCTGLGTGSTCGDGTLCPETEECDDGDANSDTEPDACRTDCKLPRCGDSIVEPELPTVDTHAVARNNRYLSIVPQNAGQMTALHVTLTVSNPFQAAAPGSWWVGPPSTFCENSGQTTPPPGGCGSAPGLPSLTSEGAQLQCTPHCMDWGSIGQVLHISDSHIVPSSVYEVRAIDCTCDTTDLANLSPPKTISTSPVWGDLVQDCTACPCLPPEGSVDITTDVAATLNKFQNLSCAPITARADVEPMIPDQEINISDVTFVLNAFAGFRYPFGAPVGCP